MSCAEAPFRFVLFRFECHAAYENYHFAESGTRVTLLLERGAKETGVGCIYWAGGHITGSGCNVTSRDLLVHAVRTSIDVSD